MDEDFRAVPFAAPRETQYRTFQGHASLARVKSDDPWGMKKTRPSMIEDDLHETINEEEPTASDSEASSRKVKVNEPKTTQQQLPKHPKSPPKSLPNTPGIQKQAKESSNVDSKGTCGGRIDIDWFLFIKSNGILMVLEIGLCLIAVVCSDFGSIFQAVWKTWFLLWNAAIVTCTSILFLFHLCRFGRHDHRIRMIFLLCEIIYNLMASLSLLLSAAAFLRSSVDPNTNRSYDLPVVIIAGVCSIIASIMFGISSFVTFTTRRNSKYDSTGRHNRSSTVNSAELNPDDEEFDHFHANVVSPRKAKHNALPKRLLATKDGKQPKQTIGTETAV